MGTLEKQVDDATTNFEMWYLLTPVVKSVATRLHLIDAPVATENKTDSLLGSNDTIAEWFTATTNASGAAEQSINTNTSAQVEEALAVAAAAAKLAKDASDKALALQNSLKANVPHETPKQKIENVTTNATSIGNTGNSTRSLSMVFIAATERLSAAVQDLMGRTSK